MFIEWMNKWLSIQLQWESFPNRTELWLLILKRTASVFPGCETVMLAGALMRTRHAPQVLALSDPVRERKRPPSPQTPRSEAKANTGLGKKIFPKSFQSQDKNPLVFVT